MKRQVFIFRAWLAVFTLFLPVNFYGGQDLVPGGQTAGVGPRGPTLLLTYEQQSSQLIPIYDFLYFVPMISPVPVENLISRDNRQFVKVISHQRQEKNRGFYVFCEFQITGSGYCTNKFDPQALIRENIVPDNPRLELKNLLDYIKLEGGGFGNFEIKGTCANGRDLVTEVKVHFNGRGMISPVTVGLYSVKPQNGNYLYQDRNRIVVARINTLTFLRTEATPPKMGIILDTVGNNEVSDSLFGKVKGFIANLIINPIGINQEGNSSLLAFADALTKKKDVFVFDKAKNLIAVSTDI